MEDLYIFDSEVFAYDWLFVFKKVTTGEYTIIHNDNDAVLAFMECNPLLVGFNNKHYDNHILKAVMVGYEPEVVKHVNDLIIHEGLNGWQIPLLQEHRIYFDSFDLMDDCQTGISLKAIEAHLGIPIEESEVAFDIDRPLTIAELYQTIDYCKYDVDATEKLMHLREAYLRNKVTLGKARGLSARKALYMTNAKLTATYLQARKPAKPRTDERDYQYPDKLLREYIPQEVFDFFDRMHDESIPADEIFSSKLELMVGDCPCTLAYGGIHGAILHYVEEATETRSIRNKDVASYYPNLMVKPLSAGQEYGYCSRNIPSPQIFADTLADRVRAKRAGDKVTDKALKLVLNTTYGAMLNGKDGQAFNDLYDPLMGRSVCITGQLLLLELSMHLLRECPTLKIIQLNTDGSEPKVKGGQLVRGIPAQGAFNINNNAVIVAKAIKQFFVDGTPPEDTIAASTNILDFQLISKASSKYSRCYQIVDGNYATMQRVNRVYAVADRMMGTLYKTHAQTGKDAKIAGLPTHCVIDNNNELSIDAIDRKWYIRLAKKHINDFLGIKPPRKNTRRINALKKKSLLLLG